LTNIFELEILGQYDGIPSWIQGDETPECDCCSKSMNFVAQNCKVSVAVLRIPNHSAFSKQNQQPVVIKFQKLIYYENDNNFK